jgi:hypothetical protein
LITSVRDSTGIISIQDTIEASNEFSFGTNILLNPCSFAHKVDGKTPQTFLNLPSKESSHKNKELSNISVSIKS